MVRLSDGYTDFFNIILWVLQADTFASYLFINSLHYILRTSIDLEKKEKENSLSLSLSLSLSKSKLEGKDIPQKPLQMQTIQMLWYYSQNTYTIPISDA